MPLDNKLKIHIERVLRAIDDQKKGPRLVDDAARLWRRVRRFVAMNLVSEGLHLDALELASSALQLPMRQSDALTMSKLGQISLRDRAEQSAELLVGTLGSVVDEQLLDRTTRILIEMPQRAPMLDEARLLADAVNLDDFGAIGLFLQMIQLTRQGAGVAQLADGCEKREQYGYWNARLKDGFHFEPVRAIARQRLEHARQICTFLARENADDTPSS